MAFSSLHPSLELVMALASHLAKHSDIAHFTNAAFPPGPSHDMALHMARDPLLCIQNLKDRYGPAVGFRLASRPVVLISSPKLTKDVLVTNNKTFVKAGTAFFPGNSLTGNGLLVSDGDVWLRQRRLSNPAFRKCVIETYAQVMMNLTNAMLETKWEQRCVRDVYADFNQLTMEIVAMTLFGGFLGTSSFDEITQAIGTAFRLFMNRATSMFIVPEWLPTRENVEYNYAVKKLDNIIYEAIKRRRECLGVDSHYTNLKNTNTKLSGQFQDLLTQLIKAKDDDSSGMDDRGIRDELMTFLVAGQETSAILLSWCAYMLAMYPQLQQRLAMEVEHIVGGNGITCEDLPKLRYTEAFVLETMRLMPPAYIIGRCAEQHTTLGNWEIPRGTTILIGIYLLHRDPLYWKQPLKFDPSRWLQNGQVHRFGDNDSYLPFGRGPRNCIGLGFAMMEVCLVLSTIVKKYEVLFPGRGVSSIKPRAMITLRPEDKVQVELVRRK